MGYLSNLRGTGKDKFGGKVVRSSCLVARLGPFLGFFFFFRSFFLGGGEGDGIKR